MKAYDAIAKITNPHSFTYMASFPGADKLGLNPDNADDKAVAHLIGLCIRAASDYAECGENSHAYGMVEAMLQYGVVTDEQIERALKNYSDIVNPEIPMNDAR